MGFLRRSTRLAAIAGNTGTSHIFPGVLTTTIAGNDVVQSELPGMLTTVLAGVPVAVKNLKASQLSFPAGAFNQATQSND